MGGSFLVNNAHGFSLDSDYITLWCAFADDFILGSFFFFPFFFTNSKSSQVFHHGFLFLRSSLTTHYSNLMRMTVVRGCCAFARLTFYDQRLYYIGRILQMKDFKRFSNCLASSFARLNSLWHFIVDILKRLYLSIKHKDYFVTEIKNNSSFYFIWSRNPSS